LFCIHAETPLSKEQFFALQQAVIDVAEKFSVEHAVFAGNNLISNIEAVWGKDVL
jgi:hypothetical protein